jgi:hypothetical protein
MSYSSAITKRAKEVIAAEAAEKQMAAEKLSAAARAEAAEKERFERQERLNLHAERELARMQAERLLAEEQAVQARDAEAAALAAEIERLRNRSVTEILQDEIASLRAEMAGMRQQTQALPTKEVVQDSIYSHLRADGELDMRFRSSKQELSVVQQEVVELKSVVASLLKGEFRIRNVCGNVLDIGGGGVSGNIIAHQWHGQKNQVWFLERL